MATRIKQNSAVIIERNLRKSRVARAEQDDVETANRASDPNLQSVESWLKNELGLEGSCKPMIEAHLAEKCHGRTLAEKKFKWDIFLLIIYTLFLVFYSVGACSSNSLGKFQVRTVLEPLIQNYQSVQSMGAIRHPTKYLRIYCLSCQWLTRSRKPAPRR